MLIGKSFVGKIFPSLNSFMTLITVHSYLCSSAVGDEDSLLQTLLILDLGQFPKYIV
jgi:hypothetical protein